MGMSVDEDPARDGFPAWFTWLRLCLAGAITSIAVPWIALAGNHMSLVPLTHDNVMNGSAPSGAWFGSNSLLLLALALWVTPRPSSRLSVVAPAIIGAVLILTGLVGISEATASFELASPNRSCLRPGCWPRGMQELLVVIPGVLAALALLAQSALPTRTSWWIRSLIPVVVLVATTWAQLLAWSGYVVPFLLGRS